MKAIMSVVAAGLLMSATAASAQSVQPNAAPSAQNSGAGIQGAPGNKNGPATNSGTVGSSATTGGQNPSVSAQDPSNVKGLPGNKSGPAAKKPQ
ncbi:MAG: hypothetical protein WA702_18245 [Bradyrhizobium sp.]|jgi:hypothetical protein|uniref:hypothetical protein n=1 Tax=Bradyrhizobium sp. TaxID=376 RepID=UPI003C7AC831